MIVAHLTQGIAMRLAMILLALAVSLPGVAQTQQEHRVALVCRYVMPTLAGGVEKDANAVIDFDSQTVAGVPATISEGQIAWVGEKDGIRIEWTLNRFTGRLLGKIVSDGKPVPLLLEGACMRAGERKF